MKTDYNALLPQRILFNLKELEELGAIKIDMAKKLIANRELEIEHEDGTIRAGSAEELMARADEDMAFAEQSEAATTSAISCFLKFGGL